MGAAVWSKWSQAATDDFGQSIVEFALVLPMLVFTLVGGAELARAFVAQMAVQNGARAGAESYLLATTPSQTTARQVAVDEINRTPGLNASTANVQVTETNADGSTCNPPPRTIASPCYVTVRVTYTFRTVGAWPLVPNVLNLERTTSMRVFK